jgi:nucleoside-diphosphate-sugar epimerase
MRVFVAGATGAIGRRLVPALVQAGHSVFGMAHSPGKAPLIVELGAEPLIVNALNRTAVVDAIRRTVPDVVVHELTAIPAALDLRKFAQQFAVTNRLRTEGTEHLLAGARAAGVRRFVAQSFAGWPYAREGSRIKSEDAPLDSHPPRQLRGTLAAIRKLEAAVLDVAPIEGIVLRYGALYGPGTSVAAEGALTEAIRRRAGPMIGHGTGIWSWLHVDDAVSATASAMERAAPRIYNIVDDDPALVNEWLPALAAAVGAKPPRRIPSWIGRLLVGEHAVVLMNEVRGASNQKAKNRTQVEAGVAELARRLPARTRKPREDRYGVQETVCPSNAAEEEMTGVLFRF